MPIYERPELLDELIVENTRAGKIKTPRFRFENFFEPMNLEKSSNTRLKKRRSGLS